MNTGIKTKLEEVTPTKADAYLKLNISNRPLRESAIQMYAQDMKRGHWLANHQGIAFDEQGKLIDGQHRLAAIVASGCTIPLMVSRGVPTSAKNGLEIFTMDTVDRGRTRTIGDQLFLRHGVISGNAVAASCFSIALICCNRRVKMTTPLTVAVLELYRAELEFVMATKGLQRGLSNSAIFGAIAFAMKVEKEKAREFIGLLMSGEGLFKTGPTSPIFALRRHLLNMAGWHAVEAKLGISGAVLNAVKNYIEGVDVSLIRANQIGIEYFSNRQKSNVSKVSEMFEPSRG